jgi:putative transposase
MGRPERVNAGGVVYHVLNRANARMTIFAKDGDYDAFQRTLCEAVARFKMRLLSYCVMPNHWHLVVWPRADGDLSRFVGWLTLTHTQRWHAHRGSVGTGHVYQGRFRSFLVQDDDHLLTVCRYVERNPLRARLCARAEAWRWSSLYRWPHGDEDTQPPLCDGPMPRPADWLGQVNREQAKSDLERLRRSMHRGRPFGGPGWVEQVVDRFHLASTFRPQGRPRKELPENGS